MFILFVVVAVIPKTKKGDIQYTSTPAEKQAPSSAANGGGNQESEKPTSERKTRQNKRHSQQRRRKQELFEKISRSRAISEPLFWKSDSASFIDSSHSEKRDKGPPKFIVTFPDSKEPKIYPGIRVHGPPKSVNEFVNPTNLPEKVAVKPLLGEHCVVS